MKFEIQSTGVAGIWEAYTTEPPLYLAITDLALGSQNLLLQIPSKVFSVRNNEAVIQLFEIVYYQVPDISDAQAIVYIEALWLAFRETVLKY